jgi:hypothetical protein
LFCCATEKTQSRFHFETMSRRTTPRRRGTPRRRQFDASLSSNAGVDAAVAGKLARILTSFVNRARPDVPRSKVGVLLPRSERDNHELLDALV